MSYGKANLFVEQIGGIFKYSCLLLLCFTSKFPLPVRYCITNVLSIFVFFFNHSKRTSVKNNLKNIFKRNPTIQEMLKVFIEYGKYWAEFPAVNKIWDSSSKVFHDSGFPPIEHCFLGVTFHIGNFEMFGNILKQVSDGEFNVIAERLHPEYITQFFKQARSQHCIKTVPHDDVRQILNVLRSGNSLGVLCDRMVGGRGVEARLFGKRIKMPLNIVEYALQKKIPIYIAYCIKEGDVLNIYSRKIGVESDFETAVQTIVTTLEEAIIRFPYQWHVLESI